MSDRRRWIRRVSAALIVGWLLVVVGSYLARKLSRPVPVEQPGIESPTQSGGEPAVRVHKGFVYTDTVGVEPNFRISARETLEFVSGRFEMHDVEVTFYDSGEVAYGMFADVARLDPARREAEAIGNARLSLGSGVAVRADGFVLDGSSRRFESKGPVAFAGRGFGGTAARVTGSLGDSTITLEGGVSASLRGAGAATVLLSPRAHYARRRATLEFPDGVELRQNDLRAGASRASLLFASPEGPVRRLVMDGPVSLGGALADGSQVAFLAGRVEISGAGEGRLLLVADPPGPEAPVVLRVQEPTGVVRELTASRVTGETAGGAVEWLEGQGKVLARESRPQVPPRQVEAANLRVEFAAGQPKSGVGSGGVRLADGGRWATGEVIQYAIEGQVYALRGTSENRVRLTGDGFSATCDGLEGAPGGGMVASGRVAGKAERRNPDGTVETVHFAGDRVSTASPEDPILLEGDARLWQQDRLIRADRLEYDRRGGVLRGSGNVISIATFDRGQEGVEEAKVRARAILVDRGQGEASYDGDVELVDPRAVVRCQRLLAKVDEKGNVQQALLTGGVQLTDAATGRSVEGQRATFDPAADILDIWGMPVLAREANGNQLKANHLRWFRASGTFVVVGEEDNPSEALYHAEGGGKGLPIVRKTPPPPGRRP